MQFSAQIRAQPEFFDILGHWDAVIQILLEVLLGTKQRNLLPLQLFDLRSQGIADILVLRS